MSKNEREDSNGDYCFNTCFDVHRACLNFSTLKTNENAIFFKKIQFYFTDILSSSRNHKETSIEKIPVRATFFSAFSAIPYILILFMLNSSGVDNRSLGIASRMLILLLGAIRCPTIGFKKFCKKSLIHI